jgi:hypothetical protein
MENKTTLESADFSNLENLKKIENDFSFLEKKSDAETLKVEGAIDEQKASQGESENVSDEYSTPSENNNDSQPLNELVEAKTVIEIADMFISRLTAVGVGMAGYKSKYTDFKLDASEKKTLAPVVDQLIQKHNLLNVSPEMKLFILLGGMYVYKIGNVIDEKNKISTVLRGTSFVKKQVDETISSEAPYGYNQYTGKPRKYPQKK